MFPGPNPFIDCLLLSDPEKAPAHELAALYHERREIETAFGELKTHLRGSRIVLRSKTPALHWSSKSSTVCCRRIMPYEG
ncbi:MAG: transposase [Deltaproteobacteria bacterium]|nr:transposase [Deltaproteobacteria bacterium]